MNINFSRRFYYEVLISIALSDVQYTEYNSLRLMAKKLLHYDFDDNFQPSIYEVAKIIFELDKYGAKNKNFDKLFNFLRFFAQKDPKRYQKISRDLMKEYQARDFPEVSNAKDKIIAIATIYNIDYSEDILS